MILKFSQQTVLYAFVTTFLSVFRSGAALSCYQCKNYGTFYTSPQLNTQDCTNSSNYAEVTCQPGTQYCLKLKGALFGSGSATPQPNTLDGVQRGCVDADITKVFVPAANSKKQDANCQTGDRYIKIAYTDIYFTNLTPTYTFSGAYCLCQGDRCNGGASVEIKFTVLMASLLTLQLLI